MYTLGTHLSELLTKIKPPQERIDLAQKLPYQVRTFLEDHPNFRTLNPHSRLVGSYAQRTPVGDVKDVDFLVRIDGNPDKNEPEAKKLIQELKQALDDLPEALEYGGEAAIDDIEVEKARRSVHVYFHGQDFHIDVVPCIAPDSFDEMIYVPDRGFNKWIPSHPIGYIKLLQDLDSKYSDKVRPLIKLFKHFRNYQMVYCRPKSYWLGALVVQHVRMENGLDMSKSLAELFHDLCNGIYRQYDHLLLVSESATPNIPDPMLTHNISWNWGRSHFETFMRRLDDGRTWSSKALETDDLEKAIKWWQKIFGENYFPSQVDEAASVLARAGLPGSAYVTSKGIIQPEKPTSTISTPVRGTTFYGKM